MVLSSEHPYMDSYVPLNGLKVRVQGWYVCKVTPLREEVCIGIAIWGAIYISLVC